MNWYKIAQATIEDGGYAHFGYHDIGHGGGSRYPEWLWYWGGEYLRVHLLKSDSSRLNTHRGIWPEVNMDTVWRGRADSQQSKISVIGPIDKWGGFDVHVPEELTATLEAEFPGMTIVRFR